MNNTPRLEVILKELNLSIPYFRMIYCTIRSLLTLLRFADSQEFKPLDRDLFQDNYGPLKLHPISQNRLEPLGLQVKGHTVLVMLPNKQESILNLTCCKNVAPKIFQY